MQGNKRHVTMQNSPAVGELSSDFNQRCKDFFRRRNGVELTDEDVREIVFNLMALFDLLEEQEVLDRTIEQKQDDAE